MSVELAFDRLAGANAQQSIAFLHGILGRGANLRSIARRFVEERANWTAFLIDLRGHGRSPKGSPGGSLQAVATDVIEFALRAKPPLAAFAGHSFGGKVALEVARIAQIPSLRNVVVIDSMPGARVPPRGGPDSALTVIETIQSLPGGFASKSEFMGVLTSAGASRAIAQWLAQSLEKENDHFRFMLDLNEIRALLYDYFSRDLWPVVEDPPAGVRIHLVIADRSNEYSASERNRAFRLAASNNRVTVHVLPTGHWVHIEDPDGLLRLLLEVTDAG